MDSLEVGMFQKVLIANRGEIAVRIIRACREMGILTVAVYADVDKEALHVMLADETVCIGPMKAKDSYLNMQRILSAAIATGADAIHPGFGFLSENAKFATLCKQCNIAFIGPDITVLNTMGNKVEARKTMMEAGVFVIPGTEEAVTDVKAAKKIADSFGYPVMIKAALGGGGKGMRIVSNSKEFTNLFLTAQSEAKTAFADEAMYLEKYISPARHIEVQILADQYGNVIHLGERECSLQRRHQKLLEESPAVVLGSAVREQMGQAAVRAAKAVHYHTVGTIEFLVDEEQKYYFMEMNTRIQVEHGVTELVTGLDLVKEQIRMAAGETLAIKQEDINLTGHAIECRINAEDPDCNFRPTPGTIEQLHFPGGCGVRIDSALYQGYKIPPMYDSLLAKVLVKGRDRKEAIYKMKSVLGELVIEGIKTNTDFLYHILEQQSFEENQLDTQYIERIYLNKVEGEME